MINFKLIYIKSIIILIFGKRNSYNNRVDWLSFIHRNVNLKVWNRTRTKKKSLEVKDFEELKTKGKFRKYIYFFKVVL